jgi:hypothetical protein
MRRRDLRSAPRFNFALKKYPTQANNGIEWATQIF